MDENLAERLRAEAPAMLQALRLLERAYRNGEGRDGWVDWNDVDMAREAARAILDRLGEE